MPIRDTQAMNSSLDNDYGATKGPNAASQHFMALFVGDPQIPVENGGGYEINSATCPGYSRTLIQNNGTNWAASVDGLKKTNSPVQFPPPTDAWLSEPTHWALIASSEIMWDSGPLLNFLQVTSASEIGVQVTPVIFYTDSATSEGTNG